ncbi:related to Methylated-DNA--protein-cysteine methyltransferase [Zygosaccharomyces bailii ISA1307]|nr:related to Methylated-DNA--protein-cysteine methyltransferase [Zygosaccharomyces bailii ISA1307]
MQELLKYIFVEDELTIALIVVKAKTNFLVYASLGPHKQALLDIAHKDFAKLSRKTKIQYSLRFGNSTKDHILGEIQQKFSAMLEGRYQVGLTYEYLFGTTFEHKVWDELVKVQSGRMITYGAIAKNIGSPKAYRAVGSAIGKNKLAIIIPCHRCRPSSGSIGNFKWGPELKRKLSARETLSQRSIYFT